MSHRFSVGVIFVFLLIFVSATNIPQITNSNSRQILVTATNLPSVATSTNAVQTLTTTEMSVLADARDVSIVAWILEFLKILISWPVILGLAFWAFRKPLTQFLSDMGQRATKISIAQFSVELPASQGPPPVWSGTDLARALQSSITTSGAKSLIEQFNIREPFDHLVVDIDTGGKWLASRLYLFTTMLQRMNNLQCIVFLYREGNKARTFLGIAHAEEVRWALAQKYPWLEAAYTTACAKHSPSARPENGRPKDVENYILSNTGTLESYRASNIAQEFLKAIQFRDTVLPTDLESFPEGWQWLQPKQPEAPYWERGPWLTETTLRDDLRSVLLTGSYVINSPDLSSSKKQKAIVNRRGRFVALVDEDKIFQELINRQVLLEKIGRNLAKPVDD